jgi:glycine/D-amino acid oxidase-like deaminating enzyme
MHRSFHPAAASPATIVIGGGFYGCMLAAHLADSGDRVILCEKHDSIMGRASLANQARVHNGYHYPRSLLTGLRSRVNFPRFVREFRDCIDSSFDKVYAIAARHSHVTARHFVNFCTRIGAPLRTAAPRIRDLFDPHHVEAVFAVEEYAFDAVRLKELMLHRLSAAGVDVRFRTEVQRVARHRGGGLEVIGQGPGGDESWPASRVFNCTYSQLNALLVRSGIAPIPLKHEVAELALVAMPDELADVGVTVMCGPFFSCMPFPSRGLHSFSHVRYTPHTSWQDDGVDSPDAHRLLGGSAWRSRFPLMVRDAARYLPALAGCRHVDSLWEVKTVLPASERDDGRPILMEHDVGLPGLTCVLAAKIDNVFDMLDAVSTARNQPLGRAG